MADFSTKSDTLANQKVKGEMFLLQALTPVHAGIGRSEEAHVDLPVQRDEFGLPVIWASSLKGALKSWVRSRKQSQTQGQAQTGENCVKLFGGDPGEESEQIRGPTPSSVSLLDARLLLIPARSSSGIWLHVTSPHLLRLFQTTLEIVNPSTDTSKDNPQQTPAKDNLIKNINEIINNIKDNKGLTSGSQKTIYLNEIRIEVNYNDNVSNFKKQLESRVNLFGKDVVVVPDDVFDKIVKRSVIVQYRVRIREDTKTVVEGALWSEEYVPQFTVFHSAAVCKSDNFCSRFKECVPNTAVFWAGGKETIGKGLLKLVYL